MQKSHLSQEAAEFSLRQVLLPKLHYPLIATNFSEKQCYEILEPALNQALPAMGINRNFPRAVAHGPVGQQGLAIPNLFTEQLISHVTMLA